MNAARQTSTDESTGRTRGRPRAFDRASAVEKAMRLFWRRGYEGAGFRALSKETGLSASSLQNTFGSKEALFQEAIWSYDEGPGRWFQEALTKGVTAREAFETLVAQAATRLTDPNLPPGCMISLAALQVGPDVDSVRTFATEARHASQAALLDRIRRGMAEGDVSADADADGLAEYFATVFRGMAIRARDGASPDQLASVGAYAMRAWPTSP